MKAAVSWAVLAACAATAAPAFAQGSNDTQEVEQVIVTARKRDESDISVPVSITAMSAAQIERNAIFNLYDIAQRTPTLQVSTTGSGVGGTIFLRGIGSAVTTGNSVDQSISLDIDGAPTSRGNMLRVGEYDLDQIQVMKGPQALFFGKNSSAGVIAFRSKDPTDQFEVMTKLAYEPYAHTRFGEFVVSGPVTDTLKARIFGRMAKSDGDKKNIVAQALPANLLRPNTVYAVDDDRAWSYKEDFVRATVLWEPTDRFTARLKASYDMQDGDGVTQVKERFFCAQSKAQFLPVITGAAAGGFLGVQGNPVLANALNNALAVDDCKLNGTIAKGPASPAQFLSGNTFSNDPNGATKSRIALISAELNYALGDHVDLTSVTGYNRISENNYDNFYGVAAVAAAMFNTYFLNRQFTQEVRLRTSFESPFNLMVGGFYQKAKLITFTNQFALAPFNILEHTIPNEVWSGFGQVTWDITDQLELAAGARYTEEKKSFQVLRNGVPQATAGPNVKFTDTSPEATLSWRPTTDLTAYAAYKTGFKSGGYSATLAGNGVGTFPTRVGGVLTGAPLNYQYKPENTEGFEVGLKAQVLDRSLRIDTAVYSYEYQDLQVSNVDNAAGVPLLRILNAGSVKQKGIEVEGSYYPPAVPGLRFNFAGNYNKSTYKEFIAQCYVGQSIAEGCNRTPAANGAFQQQDVSGRRAANAPLWTGALGFSYRRDISPDLTFEVGGDTLYKSSYNVMPELAPGGLQRPATYFNAQIRFMNEKQGWEFGVFAKNLTDERRATEYSGASSTGNCAALTAAGVCPASVTGTVNGGPASWADLMGNSIPGRTVMFQLVLRPSMWVN